MELIEETTKAQAEAPASGEETEGAEQINADAE